MDVEGTYEIVQCGEVVGSVLVRRQGLYYHFLCRCRLSGEVMFRLIMLCDGQETDLGVLTPADGCFGINRSLSVKKVGQGRPIFSLSPKKTSVSEDLVLFSEQEPFAYLSQLHRACLVRQAGKSYIGFRSEKSV